jgi:hypothetical protein
VNAGAPRSRQQAAGDELRALKAKLRAAREAMASAREHHSYLVCSYCDMPAHTAMSEGVHERARTHVLKCRMRYAIALGQGGWVVRDGITGRAVTRPATSEEAQQAVAEWNARCVRAKWTRR